MKRLLWFASVFALLYGSCILITIIGTPQLGRLMFSIFERHAAHCDQRCPIPPLTSISQYNDYLNTAQTHCHNWAQMGGWLSAPGDGMKYVCLDERFNIRPGNCVVLSFGVNNEWSFEDDMDKFGCKVYAFDPTMGMDDHHRSTNVWFLKLGISNFQGQKKIGMNRNPLDFDFNQSFPVDRYENIIERLGLSGHVIDYVKLDVELSELDFLQDIVNNSPHLLHNIKQLAIEIHHDLVKGKLDPTSTLQIFWPYFHRLHCHGFNIILSRFAGFWREIVWARDDKL
ncbi:probable methyltransferase-like protein 24 isoform X1 [Panulirus ornatus]|uniref:probable methyltransferase-like protein 24 isoform X1 n=1 Tax=Panulirus ornatus TaxID=150431 RepID=UPI003A872B0D